MVAALTTTTTASNAYAAEECDAECMDGLSAKVDEFFVSGKTITITTFADSPYFGKLWAHPAYHDSVYEQAYNNVAYGINGKSSLSYYDMLDSGKKATLLYVLQNDVSVITPPPGDEPDLPAWAVSQYEDLTTFELYDLLGELDPDEEAWY